MQTDTPHQTQDRQTQDQKRTSVKWSDQDIEDLMRLWAKGFSNAEIAKILNRKEVAVAVKASRINLPRRSGNRPVNSKARVRPCLRCDTRFHSSGPGNRFCTPCKGSSDWQNGEDYFAAIGENY